MKRLTKEQKEELGIERIADDVVDFGDIDFVKNDGFIDITTYYAENYIHASLNYKQKDVLIDWLQDEGSLKANKFNVCTYAPVADTPTHWSEDLIMLVSKGDVTIKLVEDEIRQLVKSLPRTFGGSY